MRGNTVNNMKLTIITKIRETPKRFLQPTRSECISLECPHPQSAGTVKSQRQVQD